eukprot:gnl/MRDRNA2_/MRDRNA2_34904_c0_seq1.p1 gnl/MRDRNA2_/MRDRNA2_34904_c0~~gnl/MRDRNA2_/MRDRNA2_34904_c0_seq1.p1  ORF type:complete len:319 (-),score=35.50 gnl/MRDRNA2_/MRDRNA2_34904_c0_seq1:187-1143(-)
MKRRRLARKQPPPTDEDMQYTYNPSTLERVWQLGLVRSVVQQFLETIDWCSVEGVSLFWKDHGAGVTCWRQKYLDRFGIHSVDCFGIHSWSDRALWKFHYFREVSFRLVPGERAAGFQIGSETSQLRTKPCDVIVPRYVLSGGGYSGPGQGYRYLQFKVPGGPVGCWESLCCSLKSRPALDLSVAFEEFQDEADPGETEFTGQQVTIWSDGDKVQAVAVHNAWLGTIEIPDRPEVKGISVGITGKELLTKVGANTRDIIFYYSNPGGPRFGLHQLPRVLFELDAENRGSAEVDDYTIYGDLEWLEPRLHYPISAICIW